MPSPVRFTVVDQLEYEWPALLHRDLRSALIRWRSAHPCLRRFGQPSELLRFLHAAAPGVTDQPLLALLVLSRDDPAAARFVLQAVLPALKAQAHRLTRRQVPRDELWELILFYAWAAIRTYPVARRSRAVAANLVLQVLHDTTRELDRCLRPAHARRPGPRDDRLPPLSAQVCRRVQQSSTRRASLIIAAAREGVISRRDAALILRSRFRHAPLCTLAAEAGVPYQSLLKRRQRAEQRLRGWRRVQGNVRNRPRQVLTCSGHARAHPLERAIRRGHRGRRDRLTRSGLDLKEGF